MRKGMYQDIEFFGRPNEGAAGACTCLQLSDDS